MSPNQNEKSRMHRTQLFLPKELHKALNQESQSLGISTSELIRQIVSQYLQKHNRKNTEASMRILLDMADTEKL